MTHDFKNGRKPVAVKPSFVRADERGLFVEVVNEGPWETVVHGSMKKGSEMGQHYHRECRAFFILSAGAPRLLSDTLLITV